MSNLVHCFIDFYCGGWLTENACSYTTHQKIDRYLATLHSKQKKEAKVWCATAMSRTFTAGNLRRLQRHKIKLLSYFCYYTMPVPFPKNNATDIILSVNCK